jgi:hypothetical protein
MQSKFIAVTLGILLFAFTPIVNACQAPSVPPGDDLNYFALLLRDAQVNSCAQSAHDKLLAKLDSNTWNTERVGVVLSYALATGLVLGGNGHMSDALDTKLTLAANSYVFTPQVGCGFTATTWQNGNTCLEDHAIAALAQGWRTAWYRLTARDWSTDRSAAITQIRNTLSDTVNCIHHKTRTYDSSRGPCNATLAELEADTTGNIEMMTLNHGYQNPAYGVGQLTHVSATYVGLEVAFEPVTSLNVGTTYRNMARQLYREGNAKAVPSGAFGQNCRQLVNGVLTPATTPVGCWDPQGGKTQANGYRADFFPVAQWFDSYGYSRTLAAGQPSIWPFVTFNRGAFSEIDGVWGPGRIEAYFTMANQWLSTVGNKPPLHSRGVYRSGLRRSTSYFVVSSGTGSPSTVSILRNASAPQATHVIQDLNGGNLMNGDPVAIRNKDLFYWQATNGGGSSVTAPSQGIVANSIFTIEKMGPTDATDPIAHTDFFALKTANGLNYVSAPLDGTVTATPTAATKGATERFTLDRLHTD